jgi:hypothetical protein
MVLVGMNTYDKFGCIDDGEGSEVYGSRGPVSVEVERKCALADVLDLVVAVCQSLALQYHTILSTI